MVMNKEIEQVKGNWEASYSELPQYLLAMKKYFLGTMVVIETLLTYTNDETSLYGNKIFHQLFLALQPCSISFV